MSIEQIEAITKHRWDTGDYGNAHFRLAPEVKALMDASTPKAPKPPPWLTADPMLRLMGIPVVADDTLSGGEWRLVDNSTGEIIHVGNVEAS